MRGAIFITLCFAVMAATTARRFYARVAAVDETGYGTLLGVSFSSPPEMRGIPPDYACQSAARMASEKARRAAHLHVVSVEEVVEESTRRDM